MNDQYGSDYIVITDEDGAEYELEVLSTLEYNGCSYIAAIAVSDEIEPEVIILKSVEEDGESLLCTVDDGQELDAVNALIIDSLFHDSEEM